MAVSDVYSVRYDLEMPSGAASLNFHYQETTPPSSAAATVGLADGVMAQLGGLFRAILSAQCWLTAVQVYKLYDSKQSPAAANINDGVGQSPGNALPAQFAAKIGLQQSFFPSNRNGLVWIPGIDEDRVSISQLDAEYRDGPIKAWADQLLLDVTEPAAGDGRWRLIVLSRAWLVLNPGDYPGASADVVGITRFLLTGRQRRRRTKVRGGAA